MKKERTSKALQTTIFLPRCKSHPYKHQKHVKTKLEYPLRKFFRRWEEFLDSITQCFDLLFTQKKKKNLSSDEPWVFREVLA